MTDTYQGPNADEVAHCLAAFAALDVSHWRKLEEAGETTDWSYGALAEVARRFRRFPAWMHAADLARDIVDAKRVYEPPVVSVYAVAAARTAIGAAVMRDLISDEMYSELMQMVGVGVQD